MRADLDHFRPLGLAGSCRADARPSRGFHAVRSTFLQRSLRQVCMSLVLLVSWPLFSGLLGVRRVGSVVLVAGEDCERACAFRRLSILHSAPSSTKLTFG